MYQSENIGELAKALAEAQGKFTFALKDNAAPTFNKSGQKTGERTYANLQSVIDAIKPHLAAHGLAVVQAPMPNPNGISLRTTLMHSSGQWIAGQIDLPIDRMGGIQGMGSALTYARRYALSALVGIAADEDDDGEASMKAAKEYKKQQVQEVRQQATESNVDPLTLAQLRALMARFHELGFGDDREKYLAHVSRIVGRPVETCKSLTVEEFRKYMSATEPSPVTPDDPF